MLESVICDVTRYSQDITLCHRCNGYHKNGCEMAAPLEGG